MRFRDVPVLKLERRKTSDILVDQIREYITDGALKPGDQLPTECALAEQLGVSRISVREATKTLGFLGILEAKPGRGLTVGQMDVGRLKKSLRFHPALADVSADEMIDKGGYDGIELLRISALLLILDERSRRREWR